MERTIISKLYYYLTTFALLCIFTLIVFIFFNFEVFEVWLGFIGAILGGLFTMLGVLLSLAYSEKSREDEYLNRIIPFIKACKNNDIFRKGNFEPIIIQNISDHPLTNFRVVSVGCKFKDEDIYINENDFSTVNFLPKGESFILGFKNSPLDFEDFKSLEGFEYCEFNIECNFDDYLNKRTYSHYFDFSIHSSLPSDNYLNESYLILEKVNNTYNYTADLYNKKIKNSMKKLFKKKHIRN